jgi:hypothetical protein
VAVTSVPFVSTQNGEAAMVIEGVQQQEKEDLIARLKLQDHMLEGRKTELWLVAEGDIFAQPARVDSSFITGPVVSLLASVGIADYRTILSSHHRILYRVGPAVPALAQGCAEPQWQVRFSNHHRPMRAKTLERRAPYG